MKHLASEARQVRHGGTEKREAWEGCQGSGMLKAIVRMVISAAAPQMDQDRATDHLSRSSRRGLAGSKITCVWAGAPVLAWLDAAFFRAVT